jgi:hypothetical protein
MSIVWVVKRDAKIPWILYDIFCSFLMIFGYCMIYFVRFWWFLEPFSNEGLKELCIPWIDTFPGACWIRAWRFWTFHSMLHTRVTDIASKIACHVLAVAGTHWYTESTCKGLTSANWMDISFLAIYICKLLGTFVGWDLENCCAVVPVHILSCNAILFGSCALKLTAK